MMRSILFTVFFLTTAATNSSANAQVNEYFWSFENLNEGAANSAATRTFNVGETASVFLYYSAREGGANIGGFWDVETTQDGVIDFLAAETFEFAINEGATTIGYRWTEDGVNGGAFGPSGVSSDGQSLELIAFTVTSSGILEINSGPEFVDQGYDGGADAFLFGSIDFVAREVGTTRFNVSPGVSSLCYECFEDITITVVPEPESTVGLALLFVALVGNRRR